LGWRAGAGRSFRYGALRGKEGFLDGTVRLIDYKKGWNAMTRSNKANSILAIIGIMAMYLTICDFAVLTPAMDTLATTFPNETRDTIMLASTITALLQVPSSFLVQPLVTKFGYKPTGIFGLAFAIVGGAFPFLLPELTVYWPIILSRALLGIGMGIFTPLGGAMIIQLFDGKERARLLGIGQVFWYAGGFIYSILAGFLCSVAWNFTFLSYFFGLIPLALIIFFLPRVKVDEGSLSSERRAGDGPVAKERVGANTWGYVIIILGTMTFGLTAIFLSSFIIPERGMGGPAEAGLAGNGLQIGGILLGAVFGFVVAALKSRSFVLFGLCGAAGMLIMAFVGNIFIWTLGLTLQGFAHVGFVTSAQTAAGYTAPKSRIAFVNAMCMGALNLGTFLTPYWLNVGDALIKPLNIPGVGTAAPLIATAVVYVAFAVFAMFFPFKAIKASLEEKAPEEAPATLEETRV
jgi:MFS family permease